MAISPMVAWGKNTWCVHLDCGAQKWHHWFMLRRVVGKSYGGLWVLLFACSCSSGPDPCGNTCQVAKEHLNLSNGTAHIVELDGTEATVPIVTSVSDAGLGTCYMDGLDEEIMPDNTVNGYLMLECSSAGHSHGAFLFGSVINEPRGLTVGDYQTSGRVMGLLWGDCTEEVPNNLLAATITISVDEAVGGVAPYPSMVTSDYRRHFSVSIDSGTLDCSSSSTPAGCPLCQRVTSMLTAFEIEQTAADYTYTDHGPCMCE